LRDSDQPFGGIQLVLCGDFLQLPPVPDRERGVQVPSTFAFDAKSWRKCVPKPVFLKKVFRQKNQGTTVLQPLDRSCSRIISLAFVNMLNAMRVGYISDSMVAHCRRLARPLEYSDGIEPTELGGESELGSFG